MLKNLVIFIISAFVLLCSTARADDVPIPPTPTHWVTDSVGFLSAETKSALETRLEQYELSSRMKVAVWIGATAGDAALETWTTNAIDTWKKEQPGFGTGVVLFVLTQDKAIDIEVAPGLEKQLPDQFLSQIIWTHMAPRLDKGDPNGALTAAVDALLTKLQTPMVESAPAEAPANQAETQPVNPTEQPSEPTSTTRMPSTFLLVALGALILMSFVAIGAVTLSQRTPKS